jgi:hypothetical protein
MLHFEVTTKRFRDGYRGCGNLSRTTWLSGECSKETSQSLLWKSPTFPTFDTGETEDKGTPHSQHDESRIATNAGFMELLKIKISFMVTSIGTDSVGVVYQGRKGSMPYRCLVIVSDIQTERHEKPASLTHHKMMSILSTAIVLSPVVPVNGLTFVHITGSTGCTSSGGGVGLGSVRCGAN